MDLSINDLRGFFKYFGGLINLARAFWEGQALILQREKIGNLVLEEGDELIIQTFR